MKFWTFCSTPHSTGDQVQGISSQLESTDRPSLWPKWGRQADGRSAAIGTSPLGFLHKKYSSFGACPSPVLFGLCPVPLPQQSEAIRLPFLSRRPKLCGWKILLLPGGCCFITGMTVSLRPQTGFPRFCYHNTIWLWFFLFALCNHVSHKIEPVLH